LLDSIEKMLKKYGRKMTPANLRHRSGRRPVEAFGNFFPKSVGFYSIFGADQLFRQTG
jgi:hypothetical protein